MHEGARRLTQALSVAAGLFVDFASSFAAADQGPGDCLGVGFDVQHPVTIAKIIADKPQVHFIKNASDNAACPADVDDCQDTAYLVPGDLMLVGKTRGAFSCVSYQSATDRRQHWTVGWVRSRSLTPVSPTPSPSRADWIGTWIRAGGKITIKGLHDRLRISGEAIYPAAENVHSGVIRATATPAKGILQFAGDGTAPFDQASADSGDCLVRMQRIADLLVVQDSPGSTGANDVVVTAVRTIYRATRNRARRSADCRARRRPARAVRGRAPD